MNFVENIGLMIPIVFLAGMKDETFAAICGFGFAIGRVIYSYGYVNFGVKGRYVGAAISELAFFGGILLAGYEGFTLI